MAYSLEDIASLVHLLTDGTKSGKVEAFLLSSLKPRSLPLYVKAIEEFRAEIHSRNIRWSRLSESDKDYLWAEYIVEYRLSHEKASPNCMAVLLAAKCRV